MRLQLFLYRSFSTIFYSFLPLIAFFSPKMKKGIQGRKKSLDKIKSFREKNPLSKVVWFHCASLGEFEQALPLINQYHNTSKYKVAVSFFSPSGYEPQHQHPKVDIAFYLPFDQKHQHQKIISALQPQKVIIIKYEFWYYLLSTLHQNKIPLYLVSAYFLEHQIFFKKYGTAYRKMLGFFDQIFVQDEPSKKLLQEININHVIVSGDTRIDNAINTRLYNQTFKKLEDWLHPSEPVFIAGSTWKEDIILLSKVYKKFPHWNWIIAPHNINDQTLQETIDQFPQSSITLWTQLGEKNILQKNRLLIINSIGQLKQLYQYADYVWIGGGFNSSGIHNLIEAAVYNNNIFIGPHYNRFKEATDLIKLKGIQSFNHSEDLIKTLEKPEKLGAMKEVIKEYIHKQSGATKIIWAFIENELK